MKKLITLLMLLCPLLGSAQQWVIDFSDRPECSSLVNGMSNGEGNVIVVGAYGANGGYTNHFTPMLMKLSPDGSHAENVMDNGFDRLRLNSVVRLNNGNYLTAGVFTDGTAGLMNPQPYKKVGVIVFNDSLDVIGTRVYESEMIPDGVFNSGMDVKSQLLLDDDGTVVLCGTYSYIDSTSYSLPANMHRPYFYRFNESGDTLACRYLRPKKSEPDFNVFSFECYQIVRDPQADGYMIMGRGLNGNSSLLFYDENFNYVRSFCPTYNGLKPLYYGFNSDFWLSDDRVLTFGHTPGENLELLLADIDIGGSVNKYVNIYHPSDTSSTAAQGHCMAVVNDTTIYGGFYSYHAFKDLDIWPGVCLFDKNMELLGIRYFPLEGYYECFVNAILPAADGGCLLLCTSYHEQTRSGLAIKLSREDLNPIPCGVKEIPQERLQALAFPNPTHGELNIDISGIPENTENRVSITDMQGMVRMSRIIRGNGNLLTIDASSLEAGTYVYSVFNSEKELLKGKFVKE